MWFKLLFLERVYFTLVIIKRYCVNKIQVSSYKINVHGILLPLILYRLKLINAMFPYATYSRITFLINSNRISVCPSQSQITEPFYGENDTIFRITHDNTWLIVRSVVVYGNSRRGNMPKSSSSAIINYSSHLSNSIVLNYSAHDVLTM